MNQNQMEIPTLPPAEHISKAFTRRFQQLHGSQSRLLHTGGTRHYFFQYALPKCTISTILKSVLFASLLFLSAKKPNLFFVQRKSGLTGHLHRNWWKHWQNFQKKRSNCLPVLRKKLHKYISHFMFSHRHFEKKGASWWGWGGSDILLVENLLKKQFSILIIIPGHLEKKRCLTFTLAFISSLTPWWFFLCWQKQISGPPKKPHTHKASFLLALSQGNNQFFKSSFSLSEVPICLGEDYRLNSAESNWISLPLRFWSIPLSVDSGFLLKIVLFLLILPDSAVYSDLQAINCWFGGTWR